MFKQLFIALSVPGILCTACSRPPEQQAADGVITISYTINGESDSILSLFKNAGDEEAYQRLRIKDLDSALCSGTTMDSISIVPLEHLPTPGRLFFRCTDSSAAAWHIIINEESGQSCWIRKGALIEFSNWLDYFKGADYVTSKEPLRKAPQEAAVILPQVNPCRIYIPDSMTGEWLQVTKDPFRCDGHDPEYQYDTSRYPKVAAGWIRWRTGKELQVNKGYAE